MKNFKRSILAIVLAVSILIVPVTSVKQADAAAMAIEGVGIVIGAISLLNDLSLTSSQRLQALYALRNSWQWSIPSSSYRVIVPYEQLSNIALTISQAGLPCNVFYVTANDGQSFYCIRATGEPYRLNTDPPEALDNFYNYTNAYYCVGSSSSGYVFPIATNAGTNSLLTDIKGILNSWVSTASNNLGVLIRIRNACEVIATAVSSQGILYNILVNIDDYVQAIAGYVDTVETSLGNITTNTSNLITKLQVTRDFGSGVADYNITPIVGWIYDNTDQLETYTQAIRNSLLYTHSGGSEWSVAHYLDSIYYAMDSVEGYTDGLESALSNINNNLVFTRSEGQWSVSHITSAILDQISSHGLWVSNNTSNLNNWPTRTIPYDTAVEMIAYINENFSGKNVYYLSNTKYTESSYRPQVGHAFIDGSNRIRITGLNSSGNASTFTLVAPDQYIYVVGKSSMSALYYTVDNTEYSIAHLVSDMTTDLSDIKSALYGVNQQTRDSVLVPVGQTALMMVQSFESSLTPLGVIGGLASTASSILDVVDDLFSPDYSIVLNRIDRNVSDIENELQTTVGVNTYSAAELLYQINQHSNDIYEWLDSADLLNDQNISLIITNWGDDAVEAISRSNNILTLYDHAFGDLNFDIANQWQYAYDYFDNFYDGGY